MSYGKLNQAEIDRRVDLHPVGDEVTGHLLDEVRANFKEMLEYLSEALPQPTREASVAFTHLEDSLMWSIKAIVCNQGETAKLTDRASAGEQAGRACD